MSFVDCCGFAWGIQLAIVLKYIHNGKIQDQLSSLTVLLTDVLTIFWAMDRM
jgi:hypothetical protein